MRRSQTNALTGARPTSQPVPFGLALIAAALILLNTAGCTYERTVHSTWGAWSDNGHDDDGWGGHGGRVEERPKERLKQLEGQWAILLATVDGEGRQKRADVIRSRLTNEARMPNVWIKQVDQKILVYRGHYVNPASDIARDALRQTRMVQLDGRRPFDAAQIVSTAAATAVAGPYDLRQFPGMYTLQVEVYDDQIGDGYQEVADDRVRTLRDEGEEAYCYHGPFRSQVTVGLFSHDEAFVPHGMTEAYSPAVKKLQEQHPLNLYNGRTMIEKSRGRRIGEQTSSLVRVPQ